MLAYSSLCEQSDAPTSIPVTIVTPRSRVPASRTCSGARVAAICHRRPTDASLSNRQQRASTQDRPAGHSTRQDRR